MALGIAPRLLTSCPFSAAQRRTSRAGALVSEPDRRERPEVRAAVDARPGLRSGPSSAGDRVRVTLYAAPITRITSSKDSLLVSMVSCTVCLSIRERLVATTVSRSLYGRRGPEPTRAGGDDTPRRPLAPSGGPVAVRLIVDTNILIDNPDLRSTGTSSALDTGCTCYRWS